ncbi:MAG: TonB-dependent receptor [Vicinamibacterales bacterium]
MQRPPPKLVVLLAAFLSVSSAAYGQATTGSIAGRIQSTDGLGLPGVTAVVTSPMLQGSRTVTTSGSGDYLIPLLPPGIYTLVFELDGFQSVKRIQQAAGAYNATLDVTMSPASVREEVTVIGDAQPLVETALVATTFKQNLMSALPSNRTIDAVLLMAPALHATGPRGAYSINGSQSYENVYTLDGAIINENLRGAPMNPYIEDALQEVTVATAGVSAEYGRFSGGIANAITKSGGNIFSGSFRTSFANENWRAYSPFDLTQLALAPSVKLKLDKIVPTYEATFGGPIAKERLWFFAAMRRQQQESTRTTFSTLIPYIRTNDEKRYEGKLTYTPTRGHSVRGSYLYMDQVLRNNTGSNVMDLESLTNQGQPQNLYSLHYAGVLRPDFFVEAQYSARHLTFTDVGANTKDLIGGTMILDASRNGRFWSPTLCSGATCDGDEQRNNSNFVIKASSFVPTQSYGTHHVVFGYDYFNDNIWANTHASGSDYRIRATSSVFSGGVNYPRFIPGTAQTSTIIEYTPILQLSKGSNLRTHALFVNDTWRAGDQFTLGLGLRVDRNQATDGGGKNVGDEMTFSPRLSAVWAPSADGGWSVSGSVARYVMALTSNLAGATTAAGNAANYRWYYEGPPINANADGPFVDTATALTQLFQWFNANSGTSRRPYVSATVPGFNMTMPEPLKAPYSIEYAGGVSRTMGRASVRVDGVFREYKNLYSQRTDLTTGRVFDGVGNAFDLTNVENTNDARRRYEALVTQGNYAGDRYSLGGNYTLSRAHGNVEAETLGGPSGASLNSYPEYRRAEWNYPDGDLSIDQRHRARGWATYSVPMNPSAGSLAFGLVQQIGSGVPYGAIGLINPSSFMTNPGYALPPAQLDYYFMARDAFRTETTYRTDASVNYSYGLRGTSQLFFHGEVLNVFNQFQLCGCGDTVFNNGGSSNLTTIGQQPVVLRAPFNPFTTQPIEGINWVPHANFGKPASTFAYTTPRLFRFSVGVRF